MTRVAELIRGDFLAWQCRIRQIAMRQNGGRPSPGMRPRLTDQSGSELAPAVTVLIVPNEPEESTDFFRFQVLKSSDPRDVYERALAYLQADYFQKPESFSDRLIAIFPGGSPLVRSLLDERECILEFSQFSQRYRLPCTVGELAASDPAREAAVWHNRLFNPLLPGTLHVLGFRPQWASAEADPAPRRKARP
jgi:hypothetical protein